jgi:two-component system, NarL family, sensor kinase
MIYLFYGRVTIPLIDYIDGINQPEMKKLLSILLWIISLNSYGQLYQKQLDSLNKKMTELSKQVHSFQNDTLIINCLISKSTIEASNVNTERGIFTAKEALRRSEKIGWKKGVVNALFKMAESEQVKSRYFTTIKYGLKILSLLDKKEDLLLYLATIRLIAGSYMWMEKPKESLYYYNLFLKEMNPKITKRTQINDTYTELGILYIKLLHNPNMAYSYFEKSKKNYEANKDTFGLAYLNSYLGLVYEKKKQPKLAEQSFDFAIKYYKKLEVDYLLPDALNNASEYYYRKGDFQASKNLANQALAIAQKMNILYSIRDANKNLSLSHKATGNFEKALKHYKTFADSRDSMSEANIDDRLKVVRYEYDTQIQKVEIEKKTKENQKQNNLIISLLIGILAISLIAFLAYRNINIRKQIAEKEVLQLQQEKQLEASNAVIKGQESERSRLARDLHDGLGGLLSGIKFSLNSMTGNMILSEQNANTFSVALNQLDSAISEMRRVAHSMMPEALLKFGLKDALQDFCEGITQTGKLKVRFQALGLEGRLEQSTEVTLYRITQELLNNTMKHAQATEAHVQLMQDENMLTLTVEDNGKGFNINDLQNNKGAGISNVESRVAYLNGKLDIKSDDTHGTSVEVQITV